MIAAPPVRVLIVDDQTLFRSGLARLLAEDERLTIIGEAVDGADAVEKVRTLSPDVVLMDMKMPNLDGVGATKQILANRPETKIVILTTFEADTYVMTALQAGAAGYVLKDSSPESIVSTILAVNLGDRVMAGRVASRVLDMITGKTTNQEFYDDLTRRETEILRSIATGKANKQIAFALGISEKTVRNHISNIYEKLGIYDRSQAVLYAVRKGLVEL